MERLHESLEYRTPYEVYVKERQILQLGKVTMHLTQPCFLS
jgi:hypothetical protein